MYKDSSTGIFYLSEYAPYWITDEFGARMHNPDFQKTRDGRMLDFKKNDEDAISYYCNAIEKELKETFHKYSDICIVVVPSHDAKNVNSGMKEFGERLADECGVADATGCLVRHTSIKKLSNGGDRSIQVHLDSIEVKHTKLIKDKQVVLIDDVTTSGNSLLACKQLLLDEGAKVVVCIALAKTTH